MARRPLKQQGAQPDARDAGGLVDKQLTFRNVLTAVATFFALLALLIRVRCPRQEFIPRLALAQQQLATEAPRPALRGSAPWRRDPNRPGCTRLR
jgi:hypothetical protein